MATLRTNLQLIKTVHTLYKQQTSCLIHHNNNSSASAIPNPHHQAPKMSAPKLLLLIFFVFLFYTHVSTCNGLSVFALDSVKTGDINLMVRRVCTRTIEDCLAESGSEMDSDTSRRVLLMRKKYISYDTLKRDMVPCVRPGASYYDCQGGEVNPYNRGCEVITRCARDIRGSKT